MNCFVKPVSTDAGALTGLILSLMSCRICAGAPPTGAVNQPLRPALVCAGLLFGTGLCPGLIGREKLTDRVAPPAVSSSGSCDGLVTRCLPCAALLPPSTLDPRPFCLAGGETSLCGVSMLADRA